MDLSDIRKLVRLMQQAELSELEIDDTNLGLRIHLKRGPGGQVVPAQALGPVVQVMPNPVATSPASEPVAPAAASAEAGGEVPAGTELLKSPMVGTFYRAPSPDAEPFAEVGREIDEETVVCIIEAMKVMNEIKAEMKGVIAEILVENGEPVEFGQPLFLVKKS